MKKLFKQFSFPGGIPSHVAPETPGSIHEGGELGYALSHAYGAAFDNPDLIVACVVGDGEAETGPLAASWHSNKFLNPVRDGAVLPILHLNGYKIANPTVLARIATRNWTALFEGYGYKPYFVEGSDPRQMHQLMAATLDRVDRRRSARSRRRPGASGKRGAAALADDRPAHAQGLDRPEGGGRQEDRGLLALAPGAAVRASRRSPAHVQAAREVDEELPAARSCSTRTAGSCRSSRSWPPKGERRMSANPHANGGLLLRDLRMPDFRDYAVDGHAARRASRPRPPASWASSCAT